MFSSFHLRAFLVSFTSAFLCFIFIWMAALLLIHPSAHTSSSAVPNADTSVYLPDSSDCMTLLMCEKTDSPQLFFLLRFDPAAGKISVCAFPKRLTLELDGVAEPAEKIYISREISGIKQAIFQTFGITVENHLLIDRSSLIKLLDLFDPTPMTLDKDFSLLDDGIYLTLKKGLQLLDGQRLISWLRSQTPQSDVEQCEFLSRMLCNIINSHSSLLSLGSSEELFSAVVNHSDTDLIFADYDSRRRAAAFMAQLCDHPAVPLLLQFERNPDATLSLSDESLQMLSDTFS